MPAQDYPVSFPYGATDDFYYYTPTPSHPKTANWVGNYHKGDDRAMPVGTEIKVNGVTIGLSGSMYGGAHLHVGRFVGGQDTNPNGQGFQFNDAVVTEISSDSTNGKYVRIQADGASWVYLHMSNNSIVSVGQKLEGEDMAQIEELQQQVKDMQGQIDILRPDLVNANKTIDGLRTELDNERKSYEAQIAELKSLKGLTNAGVIKYLQDNLK